MGAIKPWTAEDDINLIRLRSVEHKIWAVIGNLLGGRSKTACQFRYTRIVPKDQQVKLAARRSWTDEQAAELHHLRYEEKISCRVIAETLGMTEGQVTSKLDRMSRPGRQVRFERETIKFKVPQECLDDRNRRFAAERDLTAMFFGDPEPGRSALDRKLAMVPA